MKLIIHGGFFSESSTNHETKVAKQTALLHIVKDSYAYLQSHSAVETVVYAVSLLEDDALFNAGIFGKPFNPGCGVSLDRKNIRIQLSCVYHPYLGINSGIGLTAFQFGKN